VHFWEFIIEMLASILSDRDEVAVAIPSGDGLLPFLDELLHNLMGAQMAGLEEQALEEARLCQIGKIFALVDL
jgi:hypothetical protein